MKYIKKFESILDGDFLYKELSDIEAEVFFNSRQCLPILYSDLEKLNKIFNLEFSIVSEKSCSFSPIIGNTFNTFAYDKLSKTAYIYKFADNWWIVIQGLKAPYDNDHYICDGLDGLKEFVEGNYPEFL